MTSSSDTATISLARQLIAQPSVTPKDLECQNILIQRLEAIGFDVTRLRFNDVDNFWATRGTDGPIFAFAGHTDVVPTGDKKHWKHDPFTPTIEEGLLYGRGAADMKGSLASMVIACETFVKAHPDHKGQIAFLITSDEEGPAADGTVRVVKWLEENNTKIKWCLVGEPSSTKKVGDTVKNGRRGSLGAELKVKGVQGHVAYPHLAKNPIHLVAPALDELARETWDEGNEFFPPTSFQVSNFNSGTGATNVVPGDADIVFNFRFSTELTASDLKSRTEKIFAKHNLEYDLKWHLSGEPFLTAEGELVAAAVNAIKVVAGLDTNISTAGGTSDGRFIAPTGAQVLELGPVNATIHQVDECVSVDDLNSLSAMYTYILTELLAN